LQSTNLKLLWITIFFTRS